MKGKAQEKGKKAPLQAQPRVYSITPDEARSATDVLTGTLLFNGINVQALFDSDASHSFVAEAT